MHLKEFELHLGVLKLTFSAEEVDQTLRSIVNEMRSITSTLDHADRDLLRTIMKSNRQMRVNELLPDFARGSAAHETLRKLRDAQFIRPAGSGPWKVDTVIEVKPFGRLMWAKLGE